MTILHHNSGVFSGVSGAGSVSVARSTGSFGSGTTIVIAMFSNQTWTTPGTATLRHSSVVTLGLYAWDLAGTGQASIALTPGGTGTGQWYVWELSAGSTYDTGVASQAGGGPASQTITLTPGVGAKHLLGVAGGIAPSAARSVTGWSNSFVQFAGGQGNAQDWAFSAGAERDVTGDGSTAFSTTATFSAAAVSTAGLIGLSYINNAGDVTAPTVPTGLQTTAIGSTTADFSWTASTDAVGVTGYELIVVGP